MSDGIRPDRLDDLFDGRATPETDEERDMLHLAAELRASAPPASQELHDRIAALGEPATRPTGGRTPWWRRLGLRAAAPALAGLIVVLVAVAVIARGGSDDAGVSNSADTESVQLQSDSSAARSSAQDAQETRQATQPSPEAPADSATGGDAPSGTTVTGTVRRGSLDQAESDVVDAVTTAGGTITSRGGDASSRTIVVNLTGADRDAVGDGLAAIDAVDFDASMADTVRTAPTVRLVLTGP